jgi:hypothetical protein
MSETAATTPAPAKASAPWRGRKRVADPQTHVVHIRCTPAKHAAYDAAAARAGISISEYFRTMADGKPGPRAIPRPPIERAELARLLGELGKLGSNVNQMARAMNTTGDLPERDDLAAARAAIEEMRGAVMKALGRGD